MFRIGGNNPPKMHSGRAGFMIACYVVFLLYAASLEAKKSNPNLHQVLGWVSAE